MKGRTLYFAYGSNLDTRAMAARCPTAERWRTALLRDWQLTFRGVADIEQASGQDVWGGLWWCTDEDMKSLDRYEGAPHLYDRREVEVETAVGTMKAITYVMVKQDGITPPSSSYLATIRRGYSDFVLPHKVLTFAVKDVYRELRAIGITEFVSDGPKRLKPAPQYDGFEWGDVADDDFYDTSEDDFFHGMSIATRKLFELEAVEG